MSSFILFLFVANSQLAADLLWLIVLRHIQCYILDRCLRAQIGKLHSIIKEYAASRVFFTYYQVLLCRFRNSNLARTANTLYKFPYLTPVSLFM